MRNRPIPEATVARLPCLPPGPARGSRGPRRADRLIRGACRYGGGERGQGTEGPLTSAPTGPAVGYDVEYLLYQITRELGLTQDWPASSSVSGTSDGLSRLIEGSRKEAFGSRPCSMSTMAGGRTGRRHHGASPGRAEGNPWSTRASRSASSLPSHGCARSGREAVDAGVKSILNFRSGRRECATGCLGPKADLSIELQILSFYQQRTQAIATAREANRRLGVRPPA